VNCRLLLLLVSLAGFSFFSHSSFALQNNDADEAINSFLSSQKSDGEDAQSQGSAVADLNGDGKPEIVLVWTLLGPTYWHNSLTVFTKTVAGYKPVATMQLSGEAKLRTVKGSLIYVEQKVHAKNDPRCCPSLDKEGKYRWAGKRIIEVKR